MRAQAVGAAGGKPGIGAYILRAQHHALRHMRLSMGVVLTLRRGAVEQRTSDCGGVNLAVVLIFKFVQTTFAATIAQAFPLAGGEFIQRGVVPPRGIHIHALKKIATGFTEFTEGR